MWTGEHLPGSLQACACPVSVLGNTCSWHPANPWAARRNAGELWKRDILPKGTLYKWVLRVGWLPYVLGSLTVGSALGRTARTLSLPCSGPAGLLGPLHPCGLGVMAPLGRDQGLAVIGGDCGEPRGDASGFNSAQCWAGAGSLAAYEP